MPNLFNRLQFLKGHWREWGVYFQKGAFHEVLLDTLSPPVEEHLVKELPLQVAEGTRLDIALKAEELLKTIASQIQTGYIIFFDYGYPLATLLTFRSAGTARAYEKGVAYSNLLENPQARDLTCHVLLG